MQPSTQVLNVVDNRKPCWRCSITWVVVSFILLGGLFYMNPEWDIEISSWFYRDKEGFFLKDQWLAEALYWFLRYAQWFFIVPITAGLIYGYFKQTSAVHRQRRRLVYVLVALLLGPGLVVHTLFKDHWGRARPRNVIEFGGDKIHTPAFVVSDQCEKNCSFVSGHAGIAFFFMVFGFVGRKSWLWIGFVMGVAGALGRVVQGGHFFSDVVFAGFFVYFTCWLLARWMAITPVLD